MGALELHILLGEFVAVDFKRSRFTMKWNESESELSILIQRSTCLSPMVVYSDPATYYLLPTTYHLLPTTYCLLPTTYYLLLLLLPTTATTTITTTGTGGGGGGKGAGGGGWGGGGDKGGRASGCRKSRAERQYSSNTNQYNPQNTPAGRRIHDDINKYIYVTKASMLAEFFFALAIGSGMSCVP